MGKNRKPKFHCKNNAQKYAIRKRYAELNAKANGAPKAPKKPPQRVEAPYPHFRYYYKSRHPALIVGEQTSDENVEEYRYRKVMHGEKDGKRNNEKVEPNPDPTDPDPMYIGKRIRHDDKDNFEPLPLSWVYPEGDGESDDEKDE